MKDSPREACLLKQISVHGARQHNLKNIDVEIPRNTFTVITGLSGSGKSSLAFGHHLRRGPAPLRRNAVALRAPVFWIKWSGPKWIPSTG